MSSKSLLIAFLAATFLSAAPIGEASAQPRTARAQAPTKTRAKSTLKARQAKQARLYKSQKTPAAKANLLRLRADKMARIVAKARTSKTAQRYIKTRLKRDVSELLSALKTIQGGSKVDAVTEHRAMAAAGRVLYATSKALDVSVGDGQRDQYDSLMSSAGYRRYSPTHETAVEIETSLTTPIMEAITTKDGTVGPVLKDGGKPAPDWLTKISGAGKEATVKWDSLNVKQKHALLVSQSKGRSFFSDRRIPGVVFRRSINKTTYNALTLGNKKYSSKDSTLNVKGVLMEKVEFMGPTQVDDVSGVEFHVRQPGKASRNANDAFTLTENFASRTSQGHQHMPRRIPSGVLKGNSVDRAGLVDFYRRVNVTAELRSLLDGYLLKPVRNGSITYFDFLQARSLESLNQHFVQIAKTGRGTLRENSLKMGAVGFRTGELYKMGDKAFGFEVRTLAKKDPDRGRFVDSVQKGILTGRYGLKRSTMKAWQKQHVGDSSDGAFVGKQGTALSNLHYNRGTADLISGAPSALKPLLTPEVKKVFGEKANDHYGLKMLVHDWSKDPALLGNAEATGKVLAAQKTGLRALAKGGSPDSIAKTFAQSSGLYQVFTASIGMGE